MDPSVTLLARTIRSIDDPFCTKPADFFSVHVKALVLLAIMVPLTDVLTILEGCQSVDSLFVGVADEQLRMPRDLPYFHQSGVMQKGFPLLKRLSTGHHNHSPDASTFASPIFQHLTHLHFHGQYIDIMQDHWGWDWESISGLAQLTHLAVTFSCPLASLDVVSGTIKIVTAFSPPGVRVQIFFVNVAILTGVAKCQAVEEFLAKHTDGRAVMGFTIGNGDYAPTGVMGDVLCVEESNIAKFFAMEDSESEDNFWAQAEKIVERRRRAVGRSKSG